jgi:hypothetical protein
MNILQIVKPDLRDIRDEWAQNYRKMRKENPAKARELFRRLRKAMTLTEASLQANIMNRRA